MTFLKAKALVLSPWHRIKKSFKARKKSALALLDGALIKEFCGLFMAALTAVLALSVFSYDQQDNHIKVGQDSFHNWLGPAGAIVAKILYSFLGVWAVLLPGLGLLFTLNIFFKRMLIPLGRLFGFFLLVLGLSPILALIQKKESSFFSSGIFAQSFKNILVTYGGLAGLIIACLMLILAALLFIQKKPYIERSIITGLYTVRWLRAWLKSRSETPREKESTKAIVVHPVVINEPAPED
ncbi:MAG TPA: DNA translocase FtsK 4TM domain-containing protein, partial [Myxococcota bacterium]|nr:DNA translocase FtsK 4TM domain-containing protein [Myxococcota bacterium]